MQIACAYYWLGIDVKTVRALVVSLVESDLSYDFGRQFYDPIKLGRRAGRALGALARQLRL